MNFSKVLLYICILAYHTLQAQQRLQIINPVAEPIYLDSLKAFTYPEIILQSAEWTVSGWMKFETLGTWPSEPRCRTVFVLSDSQLRSWMCLKMSASQQLFVKVDSGGNPSNNFVSASLDSVILQNTWFHFFLCVSNTLHKTFFERPDGASSYTQSSNDIFTDYIFIQATKEITLQLGGGIYDTSLVQVSSQNTRYHFAHVYFMPFAVREDSRRFLQFPLTQMYAGDNIEIYFDIVEPFAQLWMKNHSTSFTSYIPAYLGQNLTGTVFREDYYAEYSGQNFTEIVFNQTKPPFPLTIYFKCSVTQDSKFFSLNAVYNGKVTKLVTVSYASSSYKLSIFEVNPTSATFTWPFPKDQYLYFVLSIGVNWVGQTITTLTIADPVNGTVDQKTLISTLNWNNVGLPYKLLFGGEYNAGTYTADTSTKKYADVRILRFGFPMSTYTNAIRPAYCNNFINSAWGPLCFSCELGYIEAGYKCVLNTTTCSTFTTQTVVYNLYSCPMCYAFGLDLFPSPTGCYKCGDGLVQAFESCDDGNHIDIDGCSAACAYEDFFYKNQPTFNLTTTTQYWEICQAQTINMIDLVNNTGLPLNITWKIDAYPFTTTETGRVQTIAANHANKTFLTFSVLPYSYYVISATTKIPISQYYTSKLIYPVFNPTVHFTNPTFEFDVSLPFSLTITVTSSCSTSDILVMWDPVLETDSPIKTLLPSHYTLTNGNKTITFKPYVLTGGFSYTIKVQVGHKVNFEQSAVTVEQSFTLLTPGSSPPVVRISVVTNHNDMVVSSAERLVIASNVISGLPTSLKYAWSISPLVDQEFIAGAGTSSIEILPGGLVEGTYLITLYVQDKFGTDSASITVIVNDPPEPGTISVSPSKGTAVINSFLINTNGWVDDDRPLLYRYAFYESSEDVGKLDKMYLLSNFTTENQITVRLPNPKTTKADYVIAVAAMDTFGSVKENYTKITLQPYSPTTVDEVLTQMNTIVQNQYTDPAKALSDINLAVSLLPTLQKLDPSNSSVVAKVNEYISRVMNISTNSTDPYIFFEVMKLNSILTQDYRFINKTNTQALVNFTIDSLKTETALKVISDPSGAAVVAETIANVVGSMNNILQRQITLATPQDKNKIYTFASQMNAIINAIAPRTVLGGQNINIDANSVTLYIGKELGNLGSLSSLNLYQNREIISTAVELPILNKMGYEEVTISMIVWQSNPYSAFSLRDINSQVTSITVFDPFTQQEKSIKNLQSPVKIHLIHYDPTGKKFNPYFDCQYWDKGKTSWSIDGCKISSSIRLNGTHFEIICECNHLTDFALGRQFAKMFPDPNYKYIAPWDGFNNFSFGLVKSNIE